MEPKSFYINYLANNDVCELDEMLACEVANEKPESVLDFGTGQGKILKLIREIDPGINLCGIDLSFLNIVHARAKNDIPFLIIGDEYFLCRLRNFDVIITCSVLCHIKKVTTIIRDMKEICTKSIIIAETTDNGGEFYFAHDYESFGFTWTGLSWYSSENNCKYKIYRYEKPNSNL